MKSKDVFTGGIGAVTFFIGLAGVAFGIPEEFSDEGSILSVLADAFCVTEGCVHAGQTVSIVKAFPFNFSIRCEPGKFFCAYI